MKKNTKIINLFSGPGAFKSATAAGIFTLLKAHDISVDMPYEFAKDLVWEERSIAFDDQLYILGKQSHRLWRVNGKVDIVICDSPLLLSLVYSKYILSSNYIETIVERFNEFDNINIFLKRNLDIPYEENGRNENLEEAIEIDNKVLKVLTEYGSPFISFNSGVEAINSISNFILKNYFNKELSYRMEAV